MTQETVTDTACRVLENLMVILQSGTFPGYMAAELAECRQFTLRMFEQAKIDRDNQAKQSETNDQKVAAAFDDLRYDFVGDAGPGFTEQPVKRKRGRPRKAK